MATQKPDLTRVWANGAPPANVVDPDTTTPGKVASGWQAEVPPFEHFNFLQKWFTQGLAHFNEQGVGVWDTDTVYPVNGLAKGSDGGIYFALQEQSGNDPVTDDRTNWLSFSEFYSNNLSYQTVEQDTKYTLTPNRHIFGEEYLWGLHKHLIDTNNSTYIEFLWSGDSTTAGDNAGAWKVDVLAESISAHYGLAVYDHINKGHSGDSATDWDSTWVDADIASNPNARVYVTRWGINDGASHGDVATYIAAMDSGLAKLRAWKEVDDLTIVVMSPSSTYDEPNNRSTFWYEQIIPELRKICRKYRAVFFDTYSVWQDARQGALAGNPRWLDDPFGDGRGIHPDAAFNHQIITRIMSAILEPVFSRPNIKSNSFTNTSEVQFLPLPTTVPNNWSTGITLWTTKAADGWLVDGKLRVFRNGNKVIQENFNTGVDDTQNDPTPTARFVRWGDATLGTWSKWYNLAVIPTLINSWVATAGRIPKYVHNDNGSCTLMGTLQGGADTSVAFTLPVEMRPGFPRTFVTAGDGVSSNIIINTNGDVQIYLQGGTFANLDGITWAAGN